MNGPMAGAPRERDERAIRHKMSVAITEADYLLMDLYERQTQDDKDAIRRVRGLLAEWRLESE